MKFMLLQHYGRVEGDVPPMSKWAPEDVEAHIKFQKDLNAELRERGEFVEAQALTGPEAAKMVLATGGGAPIVTDGPFAESKELLAGWRLVDVESQERALEIAAQASEGPGPNGVPLRQQIEVREVMGPIEPSE
ncbi:MAG: YciI family protein [Solirubrobacterales bacterium]